MKSEILSNLGNPHQLEKLYRSNKTPFKRAFASLYPELKGNLLADYWNERLSFETDELNWGSRKEFLFVLIASLVAGLIAKIPAIFGINEEFFYPRNIAFIVIPLLAAYFAWKNSLKTNKIIFVSSFLVAALVYINLLPVSTSSDTLLLACIHLPLVLWVLLGLTFTGNNLSDFSKRLDFLKYNGDLVVMTALIAIAGGIMSALTIGLFSLIGFNIEDFYSQYVIVFGVAAAPMVATYLIQSNPQLVGKVSPVIAKIFSPIVLIMLVIYLVAILYSGKDPYNDREFLFIFNALILGVMAIIFFSVAETTGKQKSQAETWILLLLSIVTVVINGIAVSAILFRISEWGITPNRAAVLGSNLLMLVNLLMITICLFKVVQKKSDINGVGFIIAGYLPIYFAWTIIVTFLFPLFFGFK